MAAAIIFKFYLYFLLLKDSQDISLTLFKPQLNPIKDK